MTLILAWLFFVVGAASSISFVTLYVADVRPWRRRDGEDPRVRLARRNILAWSGAVALLYASSVIALATVHTHPSEDAGRLTLSGIVAALTVLQLVTYILVQRKD